MDGVWESIVESITFFKPRDRVTKYVSES